MNGKGWITGLLGVWVLLSAFLGFGHPAILWSDLIGGVGIAVAGFALVKDTSWQGWIAGLLGLCLISAAFIPWLHTGTGLLAFNLLTGSLVTLAGFTAPGGPRTTARSRLS